MSKDSTSSIWRSVLIAGLVTLLVTLVRLVGELQHWNPKLFPTQPGGMGGIVGVVWLVPVVGFWFGRKLKRDGRGPGSGLMALLAPLLAIGLVAGVGFLLLQKADAAQMREHMKWVVIAAAAATAFVLLVWPRAFFALLVYGVLARAPVVGVQYLMIHLHKDQPRTHYEHVAPEFGTVPPHERAQMLMMAQVGIWIPFTILIGALFAVLGALTARGPAKD